MRRSLPFVLFAIAVLTALWLSTQPDRGRPSAGRQIQESSADVSAGPSSAPADHTAVWPPDSRMEVREAPRVGTPPPVSAPSPAARRDVDPATAGESYETDPTGSTPAFDANAFRNTTPESNRVGAVAPPAPRSGGSREMLPIALGAPPGTVDTPPQVQPQDPPTGSFGSTEPEIDINLPENVQQLLDARNREKFEIVNDLTNPDPEN